MSKDIDSRHQERSDRESSRKTESLIHRHEAGVWKMKQLGDPKLLWTEGMEGVGQTKENERVQLIIGIGWSVVGE